MGRAQGGLSDDALDSWAFARFRLRRSYGGNGRGSRGHGRAPDLRRRGDDAAQRRPDQRFAISLRSVADALAGHANLQRYDAYRQRWPARRQASLSATPPAASSSRTSSIVVSMRPRVTGTPQGLAVYQNGTRINEAYGDMVNWDFIPANAIDKTTIIAANPIFGLNALGGAVTVTMKNGFTWQGFEADLEGGSFYRAQEQIQYGKQVGNYSVYLAAITDQRRRLAGRRTRRSSPTSTATSATRRTGLSRTCNSRRGTPSSASPLTRRSSSCRRIGAASTPFPRRPITRWSCSSGPAATPIRPR